MCWYTFSPQLPSQFFICKLRELIISNVPAHSKFCDLMNCSLTWLVKLVYLSRKNFQAMLFWRLGNIDYITVNHIVTTSMLQTAALYPISLFGSKNQNCLVAWTSSVVTFSSFSSIPSHVICLLTLCTNLNFFGIPFENQKLRTCK